MSIKSFKRYLDFTILFLLFFNISSALFAQQVVDVNYEKISDNEDKVVIKLTQAAQPKDFFLKDPDRLVIDIKDAFWNYGKKQIEINSQNIYLIRWAQNSSAPLNFRVVIDLKKSVEKQIQLANDGKEIIVLLFSKDFIKSKVYKDVTFESNNSQTIESWMKVSDDSKPIKEFPFLDNDKKYVEKNVFTKEINVIDKPLIEGFSSKKKFSVFIKGKKLKLPKKILWSDGRVLVPAKEFFSLSGYDFYYDKPQKTSYFRKNNEIEVKISPNSDVVFVNGYERKLSTSCVLVKGVLYIPFVSMSNILSMQVYWDSKTNTFYVGDVLREVSFVESSNFFSINLDFSTSINSFEPLTDKIKKVYMLNLPNIIIATQERNIIVNKFDIKNIILKQNGKDAQVYIFMTDLDPIKLEMFDNKLTIFFPSVIKDIDFVEEELIKFSIRSNRPIDFEIKRFHEPERIVIDLANSIYTAKGYIEINKSGILRIRASQFKSDPPASRIVIDTDEELPYKYIFSQNKEELFVFVAKARKTASKPKPDRILSGKVIVIDPGHGGNDPGAFGISGEHIKEKDINLAVALCLAKLLSKAGATPLLTRDNDVFVSLQDRVDFTNKNKPDIFISIHFNLSEKSDITGTETYYYNDDSELLADIIHNNLTFNLKRKNGGVRKIKFFVVSRNTVPSILVEPLYLSDSYEEAIALHKDWQEYIARILFEGIKQYFEVVK